VIAALQDHSYQRERSGDRVQHVTDRMQNRQQLDHDEVTLRLRNQR
jgi:hypothetical protein